MPAASTSPQLHNFHAQHFGMVKDPALPRENFQQGGNVNFSPEAEYFGNRYCCNWNNLEESGPNLALQY